MNQDNQEKKVKTPANRRALKIGSLTVTTTAVVIIIAVLVNLVVAELPSNLTKFDASVSGLYTLSEESAEVIRGIGEDVHFYILTERGNESMIVTQLLDRYRDLNSHISWSTVDPASNPLFAEQYTDKTLSDNSVIAVSGKRSYPVDYSEFTAYCYTATGELISAEEYQYMSQYYSYYGQSLEGFEQQFLGDAKLAAAADYVTRDSIPVLYTLVGHGESALDETYKTYVDAQNIRTAELSLLNLEAVPDDCAALLVTNPTSDITADELELIRKYAKNGGKILLVTGGTTYSSAKMPNLSALCLDFGLESADGIVVEGDQNRYMMYPHMLVPNYGTSETEPLASLNRNTYALLSYAHGILANGAGNVSVIPIFLTSSSAYAKKNPTNENLFTKEDGDISGVFYLGAIASEVGGDGKLVWFSSADIADAKSDYFGGNSATFLATVNWLTDSSHATLSLPGVASQVEPLMVSAADTGLWSVVLIGVIPLAVIAVGLVVWIRRRRK
ncbi:MAG: Gldg family protein [Clostridia bacterium]|nr:Gldg family protein [Clostridia bacterium]